MAVTVALRKDVFSPEFPPPPSLSNTRPKALMSNFLTVLIVHSSLWDRLYTGKYKPYF